MSVVKEFSGSSKLENGGQLNTVARKFNLSVNECVDLSTGINPNGWPVPTLPPTVYNRLPEDDDGLVSAARKYYQADNILPVAGSQAAIQCLPMLRSACRVGIIDPAYEEHAYCWKKSGHDVRLLADKDINESIDQIDVLLIINPNNPTGVKFSVEQLMDWHTRLKKRNGWLIVDEAFMDSSECSSILKYSIQSGLIVLRSLGKFFGLAGLRVGFVFAEQDLLTKLSQILGPWTLSNPSRFIASQALLDKQWQQNTRLSLEQQSKRLAQLMTEYNLKPDGGTHLFHWVRHEKAHEIFEHLAAQGVFVRYFESTSSLRFGLPKNETQWNKLQSALTVTHKMLGSCQAC